MQLTNPGFVSQGVLMRAIPIPIRKRILEGERLRALIPHGRYQTSTLISGIHLKGACAPWLFEGQMNREISQAWVEEGLAPTLCPGSLVILDKLGADKIQAVRQALEAIGARLLHLPPYSPDFDAIESMWSKIN